MAHQQQQRQLRRQRQSVDQRTETALQIVQSVLEVGVASTLHRRLAFPSDFFTPVELGKGTEGYTFDEGWLRNPYDGSSSSSSPPSKTSGNSATFGEGEDGGKSGNDSGGSKGPKISDSSPTHGQYTAATPSVVGGVEPTSTVSPLLLPTALRSKTMSMTAEPLATQEPGVGSQGSSDNDAIEFDRMRSEALLLLQWIRDGAVEALRRNLLSRVVVGICLPGNRNSGERDRLVESFAFDVSSPGALTLQQQGQPPQQQSKSGKIDTNLVEGAVETMLRNIRGYVTSTVAPDGCGGNGGGVTRSPFASMQELASVIDSNPLPPNRYFTFRVELTQPVPRRYLPSALNTQSSAFGRIEGLGRVLNDKSARPMTRFEPTMDREVLQRKMEDPTILGQIDEKAASGYGIRMVAFCQNRDTVDCNEYCDGEDLAMEKERQQESMEEEEGISRKVDTTISQPTDLTGLREGQSVLAYPTKVDENGQTVRDGRGVPCRADTALPATIIGELYKESHGKLFKVEFHSNIDSQRQVILPNWIASVIGDNGSIIVAEGEVERDGAGVVTKRNHTSVGIEEKTDTSRNGRRNKKRSRFCYIRKPIVRYHFVE